jgi:hypothetical protein
VLTTEYEFIYPTTRDVNTTTVPFGEIIYIGCPVGPLQHNNANITEGFFTCQGNTMFESESYPYPVVDFNYITCPNMTGPIPLTVRDVPKSNACLLCSACREKNIGYLLSPYDTFINIITVCFDPLENIALYSKHKLSRYVKGRALTRPPFQDTSNSYQGYDLDTLYYYPQQQLELDAFINETIYLNKGHLAPFGDFVYRFQKYATMDYINIVPQWKGFNSGPWNNLEIIVRNKSRDNSMDFDVFTGTLDSLTYLTDGDPTHQITIPMWFWKFIPQSNDLYLGLNYIFVDANEAQRQAQVLCENIYKPKTILPNSSVNDANTGFVFICELANIRHPQLRALMAGILST